ncbi:MAG: hypothetical protein LBM92_04360 [Opitutaceae bacterium]|nr:hypothetical protein [Opitutaceae bacterium]
MKTTARTGKPTKGTLIAAKYRAQMNTLTREEREALRYRALAQVYASAAAHAGKPHARGR